MPTAAAARRPCWSVCAQARLRARRRAPRRGGERSAWRRVRPVPQRQRPDRANVSAGRQGVWGGGAPSWTGPDPASITPALYRPRVLRGAGAQVAQLVEHVTENHGVGGSIPPLGTKKIFVKTR